MRALRFEDGELRLSETAVMPTPGTDDSLVRVLLAGICNTDKEILRGYKGGFTGTIGHEFVGRVETSPDPGLLGRQVVGSINTGCGVCTYCTSGREEHCEQRTVIGIAGQDGCFAEFLAIRSANLHVVAERVPPEHAVYAEPLAAALEVLEQVQIRPSDRIAIIGDGRLAFFLAQVLALNGAAVTVFGRHPEKLSLFSGLATTATSPSGRFETVVEASGSPSGLTDALQLLCSKGTLVLKSTYAGSLDFDFSQLVVREISLVGSRCGPFEPAVRLLERGNLTLPAIEWYELDAYEAALTSRAFKAGFRF